MHINKARAAAPTDADLMTDLGLVVGWGWAAAPMTHEPRTRCRADPTGRPFTAHPAWRPGRGPDLGGPKRRPTSRLVGRCVDPASGCLPDDERAPERSDQRDQRHE